MKAGKNKQECLEPKQERFCQDYIVDLNATQAAIRAGYSRKTAQEQASRMLSKVMVQNRIAELKGTQAVRINLKADDILNECRRIALADIGQAFNPDGTLKSIHDIPEDVRRAMSGLEVIELFDGDGKHKKKTGELKKVKFWSKDSSIETLMKHLGLLKENINIKTDDEDIMRYLTPADRLMVFRRRMDDSWKPIEDMTPAERMEAFRESVQESTKKTKAKFTK
jgi:phage terminase small subunit